MLKKLWKKYLVYTLLLASIVVYGIYTGVQKQALFVIENPFEFSLYTMVYSSLFLLPSAIHSLKKSKIKINKTLVLTLLGLSIALQVVAFSLKLFALTYTTATSVGFITSFSSVFLTIYAVLFTKEKFPKGFLPILIFMTVGLLLFRYSLVSGFSFGIGEMLMLLFVNIVSISNVAVKNISKKYPPDLISFGRMVFSIPILYFIVAIVGNFRVHDLFSFWPILAGFLLASRSYTQYQAINLANLSTIALAYVFAPAVTYIYSFITLSERLEPIQMVGAAMIAMGTYLVIATKKKDREAIL